MFMTQSNTTETARASTVKTGLPLPSLQPLPVVGEANAFLGLVDERYLLSWARHQDEVREVQRLRHQVFAKEMGAQLSTLTPGLDEDEFDPYCEHLIVRAQSSGEVVGTYRLLTPAQAKRIGTWYTDTEFDLSACGIDRSRTLELGRSCIHADHRSGPVLMQLWTALVQFLAQQ